MPFSWKPLYRELAQKLLDYEHRQPELIGFLLQAAEQGIPLGGFEDGDIGGQPFDLTELDPFTFFAAFNRSIHPSNRRKLLELCRPFFGLSAPLPDDFDGIPTANNFNWWFFPHPKRAPEDVPSLWALARAAVAGGAAGVTAAQFDRCLKIKQVGVAKLTQGLFWLRPDAFLPLDGNTRKALRTKGIPPEVHDFATYSMLVEQVTSKVGEDFVELSAEAYVGPEDEGGSVAATIKQLLSNSEGDLLLREQAQAEAKSLLDARVGRLTEEDLRNVFTHLNTCEGKNGPAYTRFAPQFVGHNANVMVAALDRLNPLIEGLWKAADATAEQQALNDFFKAEIANAGKGFPTAILFLKDPERNAVWLSSLDRNLRKLMGADVPTGHRTAAAYLEYCELVSQMRKKFRIPAALHDRALFEIEEPGDKGTAVLPSTTAAEALDLGALADQLGLAPNLVKRIGNRALQSRQIVLTGPPGTGKTELALGLARVLSGDPARIELVQFHPSYGYEDFIEGLRPIVKGGQLQYEIIPGVFRRLCERARAASHEQHVLVIDEINRGNLPRILGELLMLLERRDLAITLPTSKESFSIPKNLVLIGTMNSADRSIALLDLALRRRFHFFELGPDEGALRTWLAGRNLLLEPVTLLQTLNHELEAAGIEPERLIGHSYFMREGLEEEELRDVWDSSILPLVRELFFAEPARAAEFTLERIRARVAQAGADAP